MATNFGDTIMEGSIEPEARVQQPVQDNSGAVLAESLGGAARAVGAIAGSLFQKSQEDANTKIISSFRQPLFDLADAVDQGLMTPQEARIQARTRLREYEANYPALYDDIANVWSEFTDASGLGHVLRTGTDEQAREKAFADAAYAAGFPDVESYRQNLVDGQAVVESTRRLTMLQNEGATITQTHLNQHLATLNQWATSAYPVAQRQINEAMEEIKNNPSNKQAIVENLNFVIGSQIAQVQEAGGPADSTYITTPIQGLLDTFNKFAQGTVSATMLENELKTTQLKFDLMSATDPTYAAKIAASRLLSSVGMEHMGYQMWDTPSVTALVDLLDGKGNPMNGEEGTQRSIENLTLKAGSVTQDTSPEEITEIRTGIEQLIDSVYRNERSVEGDPTAYNVAVHSLGSPEIAGFISQHGISSRYAQQVAGIFKEKYEQELLPVVNRVWTNPVPITDPTQIGSGAGNAGGVQNIPMNQLLQPRWNGNALEFVPTEAYANNPRVIQLAQDVTSGDNSIGVPVNAMINAQSLLTGVDAKTIYEEDFAGRFFGTTEEGDISGSSDLSLGDFQEDEIAMIAIESLGEDTPGAQASSVGGGNWLVYANQSAIRNKPISQKLESSMSFLKDMGITMEVFSGGETEDRRASNSGRHLHGNAADVFFYKDGKRLNWDSPEEQRIFQEIVRKARQNGVTGFGAGPGYMRPGSMHIGFGTPAAWGAGGKGENAPDWLKQAFGG